MTVLLAASDCPFVSRGVHPTIAGTPINVTAGNITNMAAVDGTSAALALSGTTNAGVMEWRQGGAVGLSVPIGEVLTKITFELLARMTAPVVYTTDPLWGVELYDNRTGATLGAIAQRSSVPISGSLVACVAGGVDTWGLTQAKILDVLSANALRIRWTSPGWDVSSTGVLTIDGLRLTVESGVAPTQTRQTVKTRRTATPGKVPAASEIADGELIANVSDLRLFLGSGAQALDLTPIRRFTTTAAYLNGDIVIYNGRQWVANKATGPGARVGGDWDEYTAAYALNSGLVQGHNLSALYDLMHPWHKPMLWRGVIADIVALNNTLATLGIVARWWIADGIDGRPNTLNRFIRGATGDGEINGLYGGVTFGTEPAGNHNHGAVTGDTAITIAQMPAHNHDPGNGYNRVLRQDGNSTGNTFDFTAGEPNLQSSAPIATQGGGQGHHHGIPDSGDHQHLVTIDPMAIRWFVLVRIA